MQILTRFNELIAYNEQGYIPVGNSAICVTSGKRYDDALISTVDCVPTDIDRYRYYYVDGKFIKGEVKPNQVLWEGWANIGDRIDFNMEDFTYYAITLSDWGVPGMSVECTIICGKTGIYTPYFYGFGAIPDGTGITYAGVGMVGGRIDFAKYSSDPTFSNTDSCGIVKIVGII